MLPCQLTQNSYDNKNLQHNLTGHNYSDRNLNKSDILSNSDHLGSLVMKSFYKT